LRADASAGLADPRGIHQLALVCIVSRQENKVVQLVQSVEDLIDNITRFSRDPQKYGGQLWEKPVHVKGWYAIRHPEQEGRWIFGPSRIVGYDRRELKAYIANQIGGSVNGGTTETYLEQWRIQVLPGQPIYDLLAAELSSFLAKFETRANVSARIYVLHSEDFVGLIDVHHLDPLAQADESRQTDPVKHCRPLCPNCHRLAHYGMPQGTCRPLDELKKIWKNRKK
jgi:hypothetical protein